MSQKKESEIIRGPLPLDESWWSAVLEEVETRYGDIPKGRTNFSVIINSEKDLDETRNDFSVDDLDHTDDDILVDDIDWEMVSKLYELDQVLNLVVEDNNKGGLLVKGDGIRGFVPASHLVGMSSFETQSDRDSQLSEYIGNSLNLKVIECDKDRGRIVFSERAAQTDPGSRLELINSLSVGDNIKGTVTTITDFGVFVDLGGVEGLIHISELSWGRVCHPNTIISSGEDLTVQIISVDRERNRVALSLKRLSPNPWDSVHTRYKTGEIVNAVITNIVSFGAFARIEEGLDGLIHISECQKLGEVEEISSLLSEGDEIEVCILHIDSGQQRLGLGLPKMDDNIN